MKIGCCTTIDHYDDVVAAGFDYIELPGKDLSKISGEELSRWGQIIKQGSIPCLGLYSSIDPSVKICGPNFSKEETEKYATLLCSRAHFLGVKKIGVGAPMSREVPTGYDLNLAWQQTREFLFIMCKCAEKYGIWILWEPLNQYECDFGVESIESLMNIVAILENGISNLGVVCDLYHTVQKGENDGVVRKLGPYIGHVHIASASDGCRGYITQADAPKMQPLLGICLDFCDTISAETASGSIRTDGKQCIETLRHWIKECVSIKYKV